MKYLTLAAELLASILYKDLVSKECLHAVDMDLNLYMCEELYPGKHSHEDSATDTASVRDAICINIPNYIAVVSSLRALHGDTFYSLLTKHRLLH